MKKTTVAIVTFFAIAGAGSAMLAAPGQGTARPGEMLPARVWVENRNRNEALPVTIEGLDGDGEELGHVEFAPGRASMSSREQGKLGALAKALEERPALKLEVSGRVDPGMDRDGLKRVALERQLRAERLKRSGKEKQVMGDEKPLNEFNLEPGEYTKLLTAVYRDAKFTRPRNALGMLKDVPVPEMEQLMYANTPVSDDDLRTLADRRAQSVKDWLISAGSVAPERVLMIPPRLDAQDIKDRGRTTRADLSFR